jgi:hypothetical protein
MKTQEFIRSFWHRDIHAKINAIRVLSVIAAGTFIAYLISLLYTFIKTSKHVFESYLNAPLPLPTAAQAIAVLVSVLAIGILKLGTKIWRSLKLGLVPVIGWTWILSVAAFWVLITSHHHLLAGSSMAAAAALTLLVDAIGTDSGKTEKIVTNVLELDLPIQEDGEDLLGRVDIVENLVSKILFEQPMVIAVTGSYGEGKTSLLNLTIGKVKRLDQEEVPIIVRFSPWLAGDSDILVLSLLNSIVAEIENRYLVPGLNRDAIQYARTLLSAIPKATRLKEFFAEPSQEGRITALAKRIRRTGRRVLIVLDDLDRMEAKELETVFKLLRGSETLSTFTFLCSFDKAELALILKANRPYQDTGAFIEKFFQLSIPLPKVDSSQLWEIFSLKIVEVLDRYGLSHENLSKSLGKFWDIGGGSYFENLRRIKLFLNRIAYSLEQIGDEVNVNDFLKLELIRDVAPDVYEEIYRSPEYFYTTDLAFEVRLKDNLPIDGEKANQVRARFYDGLIASVPDDKKYVTQLLEELFPHFAQYRHQIIRRVEDNSEEDKRIFHPRCFKQYFILKTPTEQFSVKEFMAFTKSIRNVREERVVKLFTQTSQALVQEDFKRWHFMHRIDITFNEFRMEAARGLCRGMAQNSSRWSWDAFELIIAARCTCETLGRIDRPDRHKFLRIIIRESASDLYTLTLLQWMENDAGKRFVSELQETKNNIKEVLRQHYRTADPPSVFEQFGRNLSTVQNIDPIQFLFGWKRLGSDAGCDQEQYLRDLFVRNPKTLNDFLKAMFRVNFLDDYSALKPLIDYKELSELILRNESILDPVKVEQFNGRYKNEQQEIA